MVRQSAPRESRGFTLKMRGPMCETAGRAAMGQKLGDDADEVLKALNERGIT